MQLADLVAVMNDGRIEQIGTPEQLRAAPATAFVAEFLAESLPRPVAPVPNVVNLR